MDRLGSITVKEKRIAVGLMSGTSMDGVDAALVEIRGHGKDTAVRLLDFITIPYDGDEKRGVLELCSPETSSIDKLCYMNAYLGRKMGLAALEVIRKYGLDRREIDFISSHGQTVYHMPEKHATLQIGEPAEIAAVTRCPTIADFRPGDIAAGGQGAPLVPYVDYLLYTDKHKGRALINIGGISNVTALKAGAFPDEVLAFDMGPGNMLIDAAVRLATGGSAYYDKDGEIAAGGRICREWLDGILESDVYLGKRPPKSTGREYYGTETAKRLMAEGAALGLDFRDIVATLTAYTAAAIKISFTKYIDPVSQINEIYVGGGGAFNKTLMSLLKAGLGREVSPMEALGCPSDAKEAVAFAVLGNEFLFNSPNNLPSATGASGQVIMGKLVLP